MKFNIKRYITSYITKKESKETTNLWNDINQVTSLKSALNSHSLASLKKRESGILEVADKLLGYHLFEFSVAVMYLPAQMERVRRLKHVKEVADLNESSDDIFHDNFIDTYYKNRPVVFYFI